MPNVANEDFVVTNDNTADWAVRTILEEEAERDRLIDIAKSQIDELKTKIEEITERCDRSTSFLKSKLVEYFDTVPHKEAKTQESYQLLSGKLIKKKAHHEYKYDEAELSQFLADEKMNDFIEVKVKPRWGEFKKKLSIADDGQVYIADTGELVDVVKAVEVPASFTVK